MEDGDKETKAKKICLPIILTLPLKTESTSLCSVFKFKFVPQLFKYKKKIIHNV